MSLAQPENKTGQRLLLTPGPLSTSQTVKDAMLIDIGSWDIDCIEVVKKIREGLMALAPGSETCTLLQGSGSYAVEAVLGCAVSDSDKLLILNNGAYGNRMRLIAEASRIPFQIHIDPEDTPHDPKVLDEILDADQSITHVACVHGETTTGQLNPIGELGDIVKKHGRRFIVDAISTFGSYPIGTGEEIDFERGPIDHLIGSANKCVEGVPGFAFILSKISAVQAMKGQARALSFDIFHQWEYMERTGQFRFTPPTHVLLAFEQALRELDAEGGPEARGQRYKKSHQRLVKGMRELGFKPYVKPEHQSHIITAFYFPSDRFEFSSFYECLHKEGYIIYPGKLSDIDTFRIANIGQLDHEDVDGLLQAIQRVRLELKSW